MSYLGLSVNIGLGNGLGLINGDFLSVRTPVKFESKYKIFISRKWKCYLQAGENVSDSRLCTIGKVSICIDWSLPPLAGGWPLTQPNYHFSLGGKSCALVPLNIIPKFPKEKHKFLSDLSSKSSTFMCSICMIAKGYKVFSWKLCQSKNGVCDESPPKRRTVAETFAWRLGKFVKWQTHYPSFLHG